MTWVLDANMLIYALNRKGGVRERLNQAALRGSLVTSAAAVAELLYGAEKSARAEENRREIHTGLSRIEKRPFTIATAQKYGELKAYLEKSGKSKTRIDLMVAATAIEIGATLVTHDSDLDPDHMPPGLKVEDWYR